MSATVFTMDSSAVTAGNTYLVSVESGAYLESPGSNLTASAKSDGTSQKQLLIDAGSGYFALKNSGNGQSLYVCEESTSAGASGLHGIIRAVTTGFSLWSGEVTAVLSR